MVNDDVDGMATDCASALFVLSLMDIFVATPLTECALEIVSHGSSVHPQVSISAPFPDTYSSSISEGVNKK